MNEVGWQTKIRKQIESEGGFCKKWATQLSVGVPDLIVVANRVPMFIEVKLERNWTKDTVRTFGFSEKQKLCAQEINNAYGTCFGLIVVESVNDRKSPFLFACPVPAPRVESSSRLSFLLKSSYNWSNRNNVRLSGYLEDYAIG